MDTVYQDKRWFYLAASITGVLLFNFTLDTFRKFRNTDNVPSVKDVSGKIADKAEKLKEGKPVSSLCLANSSASLPSVEITGKIPTYFDTKRFDKELIQKIVLTGGPCAGKTTGNCHRRGHLLPSRD